MSDGYVSAHVPAAYLHQSNADAVLKNPCMSFDLTKIDCCCRNQLISSFTLD